LAQAIRAQAATIFVVLSDSAAIATVMALTMSRLAFVAALASSATTAFGQEKKAVSRKEYELHKEQEEKQKKRMNSPQYKSFVHNVMPVCETAVTCPEGEKLAQSRGVKPWIYGCEYVRFLDKPEGANKALRKCCREREICLRTCGMSSKMCFESFMECQQKACGMSEDNEAEKNPESNHCFDMAMNVTQDIGANHDAKCTVYRTFQEEVCTCVPEDKFTEHIEGWMIDFYNEHQPDRVEDGALKNSEMMWKKWGGKEPEMFIALLKKYKFALEQRPVNRNEIEMVANALAKAVEEEEYEEAAILKVRMWRVNATMVLREWFHHKHMYPEENFMDFYDPEDRDSPDAEAKKTFFKNAEWRTNHSYVDVHEEDNEEM